MTGGLRAECAAVAADYPGWNVWPSLKEAPGTVYGDIYAAHVLSRAEQDAWRMRGDAVTLHAATPELMRHEIALWMHRVRKAAAA